MGLKFGPTPTAAKVGKPALQHDTGLPPGGGGADGVQRGGKQLKRVLRAFPTAGELPAQVSQPYSPTSHSATYINAECAASDRQLRRARRSGPFRSCRGQRRPPPPYRWRIHNSLLWLRRRLRRRNRRAWLRRRWRGRMVLLCFRNG
jgi:hypothetical protein